MIVQMFKFKSRLSDQDVRRIMGERAPRFREQKGLLQKFYGYEESTGMHTGIYIWDTRDSMQAFQETELAKSIPSTYQVETPPRVEVFELIFPLREMAEIAKGAAA